MPAPLTSAARPFIAPFFGEQSRKLFISQINHPISHLHVCSCRFHSLEGRSCTLTHVYCNLSEARTKRPLPPATIPHPCTSHWDSLLLMLLSLPVPTLDSLAFQPSPLAHTVFYSFVYQLDLVQLLSASRGQISIFKAFFLLPEANAPWSQVPAQSKVACSMLATAWDLFAVFAQLSHMTETLTEYMDRGA